MNDKFWFIVISIVLLIVYAVDYKLDKANSIEEDLLKTIKSRGYLIVGVKTDTRPFGYLENGKNVGFDIDIAKYIAKDILHDQNKIKFVQVTPSNRLYFLNVEKVDIISEFIPSFTRPNVEHLFPVSIEKSAKLWAEDRLKANGFSSNKVAEFIIKDASVTEEIEKSEELLQKDRLKYRANLSVVLKITDKTNMSAAETSINAWRELKIPVDTKIAEKEKYWNDMVYKLFDEFNRRMEKNINEYLNMYVMNNYSIKEYQE